MTGKKQFFKIDTNGDIDAQAEAIAENIINKSSEQLTISIDFPPNATYDEKIEIIADTLWNAGFRWNDD